MMRMMKRIVCLILCYLCTFMILASASEAPYLGYIYNDDNNPVPAPNTHYPVRTITGMDLKTGNFLNPQDLFVDRNRNIYVVDCDNNRIVQMNDRFRLTRIYTEFQYQNQVLKFNKPAGIFVDKSGMLYIADTENFRVLVADQAGKVVRVLENPKTSLLAEDYEFRQLKIVVDSTKTVYVLAYGVYQGMITYDDQGTFSGFYGGNRVETTLELIMERFWRKIFSKKQIAASKRFVPSEYTGLDIDGEDFIFTCDKGAGNQIKQLNPLGSNILKSAEGEAQFGDSAQEIVQNAAVSTAFQDIDIGEDGFINAMDFTRGRVFRYDQECNLIGTFGCKGGQTGSFDMAVAVESMGDLTLVLDSAKGSITVFNKTEYGRLIEKAVDLYNDGLYAESLKPWNAVLKHNCNFELAHNGLGKANLKLGNYTKAMENFELAGNNKGYSDAFTAARNAFVRQNFTYLAATAVFVIVFLFLLVKRLRKKRRAKMSERRLRSGQ